MGHRWDHGGFLERVACLFMGSWESGGLEPIPNSKTTEAFLECMVDLIPGSEVSRDTEATSNSNIFSRVKALIELLKPCIE